MKWFLQFLSIGSVVLYALLVIMDNRIVAFPDGAGFNPGYRLVKDPSYPGSWKCARRYSQSSTRAHRRHSALSDPPRAIKLDDANINLRLVERALEVAAIDTVMPGVCAAVEGYNLDDCKSALGLRNWLEQLRKSLAAYTPPPPEGFVVSPMTWGVEDEVTERFYSGGGSERQHRLRTGYLHLQLSRPTVGLPCRVPLLLWANHERLCRGGGKRPRR